MPAITCGPSPATTGRCAVGRSVLSARAPCPRIYHRGRVATHGGQQQSGRTPLQVCNGLKENVAKLAPITGIARVKIPSLSWSVENVEGKRASVAIYSHLAQQHRGRLDKAAALEGLELYDEVVLDARQRPGAHPNIDLLFKVAAEDLDLELVVEQQ